MSNTEFVPVPFKTHWAHEHIFVFKPTGEYVAFDEAGQEHGRYATLQLAEYALEQYSKFLDSKLSGM